MIMERQEKKNPTQRQSADACHSADASSQHHTRTVNAIRGEAATFHIPGRRNHSSQGNGINADERNQ